MNTEESISCRQDFPQWRVKDTIWIKKLSTKICPVYKKCRHKHATDTEEMARLYPDQLESHLMGKHKTLTLLRILCYTCRQHSVTVIWKSECPTQLKHMQLPTDYHWLRGYRGRVGETIKGSQRISNSIRQWESTNLEPRKLSETELPTKGHSQDAHKSHCICNTCGTPCSCVS